MFSLSLRILPKEVVGCGENVFGSKEQRGFIGSADRDRSCDCVFVGTANFCMSLSKMRSNDVGITC